MFKNSLLFITVLITFIFYGVQTAGQNLSADLKNVFDKYNTAMKERDFNKILIYCSSDLQKEILSQVKTKTGQDDLMLNGQMQIPESYEILHIATEQDSSKATVFTIMQFSAMKEIERERSRIECEIHYKKEKDQWKLESVWFLTDPDKINRPKDYTYNPGDMDLEKDGNIGGRIVRTDFMPDYTMVILRVLDEENAVFLPPKEDLIKYGISVKDLSPWNIYEFTGHPHKTDKLKFFGISGKPADN
jgi:hypothetical protein